MKPALLVIDVQKAFFSGNPAKVASLNSAVEYINYAINLFRSKNLPVISVQHINEYDNLIPGTVGFELPEELHILESDIHIHKTYGNAFNKTPLLDELKKMDVDTVFISGYRAENCVLSTCRGAEDVDLMPIIIRGSIASDSVETVQFIEHINDLISIEALEKIL
jgi:nicotinamidase-related amidase